MACLGRLDLGLRQRTTNGKKRPILLSQARRDTAQDEDEQGHLPDYYSCLEFPRDF